MRDIALCQRDPRWADHDLGEKLGGLTIGQAGCLLTDLAMILRHVYGTDVIPPTLNDALALAETPFIYDNILVWDRLAALFHRFIATTRQNGQVTVAEIAALKQQGEVILRYGTGDNTHFVYVESVVGGVVAIIDPWTGRRRTNIGTPTGTRTLTTIEQSKPLFVGYHDGGSPFALIHCQVQRKVTSVDCEPQNIVRLNWGYANGTGTLPPPEHADAWVKAVVETVKNSPPALLWHFGNEINNPSEWPGSYPNPTTIITPQYYVALYNAIAEQLPSYPIAPAPLDPYNVVAQEFGQPGDPRDWAEYIYQHITRCDGICIHAKTQTNDPAEIISFAKFTHAPLVGRYLHLRTITDQLSWIPRFKDKPVYITELNPQFRVQDVEGGWYAENTRWIHDSHTFISTYSEIRGIIYYRYDIAGDQANYGLRQFPALIDAIENYIER